MNEHATYGTTYVPPRQLVGAAATGQPEPESGAQLIAPPKKTRGPGAVSAALAAAAPAAAPPSPSPSPSPPPLPTEPLPFRTTIVEHDGARWVWWRINASPRNVQMRSGTVGTWRRSPSGTAP